MEQAAPGNAEGRLHRGGLHQPGLHLDIDAVTEVRRVTAARDGRGCLEHLGNALRLQVQRLAQHQQRYRIATGIRRAQSVTRRDAKVLELDPRGVVKVQPLAGWTDEDVTGYLFAHDVPYNPLHDRGFPSIGCTPCTRAIRPGEDSRAGRWADAEKTECGLHLPAQGGPN